MGEEPGEMSRARRRRGGSRTKRPAGGEVSRGRRSISKVGGVHRFDSYEDWVRVKSCPSKVRFADELDAISAAIGVSLSHGPARAYRCERCGGYHVTTRVGGCEEGAR